MSYLFKQRGIYDWTEVALPMENVISFKFVCISMLSFWSNMAVVHDTQDVKAMLNFIPSFHSQYGLVFIVILTPPAIY